MRKILVTGGAGFIGSHTAVMLHEAGYDPVIVDDFSSRAEGADPDSTHLVSAGWEWKIDDFTVVDELPDGIESIE